MEKNIQRGMKFGYRLCKIKKAERTNILSAKGSTNLPKDVVRLYFLAMYPSKKSVMELRKKINRLRIFM